MRSLFAAALAVLPLAPAGAHPHMFVDTTLTLTVSEEGMVTAVDVTWAYDDFFSLLIFEDLGLDPEADGVLTEAELETLRGFDLIEWPEGFEGDLYMAHGGEKVDLSLPEATGIAVEKGRIVASHRREVEAVPVDGLEIRQYDPTYYVAYALSGGIGLPDSCEAMVEKADRDAADRAMAEALKEVPEDQFEVLEMGIHYADTVRIRCGIAS